MPFRLARNAEAAFRSLPQDLLPASARVDFLHFLVAGKPAVRVKATETAVGSLHRWSMLNGYGHAVDEDGYSCVAMGEAYARHVLEVDQRVEPHELTLGLLLGYPRCCCEKIAHVGESQIDQQAAVIAEWEFEGWFRLINPSKYRRGASLIYHLPCSPTCSASLRLARRAARFLRRRLDDPAFASWSDWKTL
jgi:hypothetical protein